jgi:hypothetical protein
MGRYVSTTPQTENEQSMFERLPPESPPLFIDGYEQSKSQVGLCEEFLMPVSKRRKPKHSGPTEPKRIVVMEQGRTVDCDGCSAFETTLLFDDGDLWVTVEHEQKCTAPQGASKNETA